MSAERFAKDLVNTNDTIELSCTNAAAVGLQLAGTWSGTVTFEGTIDGTNWSAIRGTPIGTVTPTSTAAANGIWQFPVAGLNQFRARFSTASSGTVNATAQSNSADITKY